MNARMLILMFLVVSIILLVPSEMQTGGIANAALPVSAMADAQNVRLVGCIGGPTYAVAVQGSYAYVGEGHRLTILDISNPTSPSVVGKTPPLPDIVQDVAIAGGYAYVADGDDGLWVVNISTPANPTEEGSYDMPGYALGVAVAGSYAYVADGNGGLRVVDVSAVANPVEVGFYDTPGGARGVAVVGNYAYVAAAYGGLRVVDVSAAANPVEVGFYDTPGYAQGVAVAGNYAYVADEDDGLRVVDVSTPTSPAEVGFCDTPGYAQGVVVADGYAYVAAAYGGLRVVDVSAPTNPAEVGFYDTPGYAQGVAVAGNYAYVADEDDGLRVVDVFTPAYPTEVGFYDTLDFAEDVATTGSYAYVADGSGGLRVVDTTTPANPVEVGSYDTPGYARSVAIAGGYAYVADQDGGLRVVDVSTPTSPAEVGFCDTPGYAQGVVVADGYAYVADGSGGLRVVDVSVPADPVEVGSYDTPGYARDVAVAEGRAYVADGNGGLRVVDVSVPSNPWEAAFYDTPGYAEDVTIAGGYAYLVDWDGLQVVDVTLPSNPVGVISYETPGNANGVAVDGSLVYVAEGGGGETVRVIDVSVPSNPTQVGFCHTREAFGVAVAGGYAYVADGSGGLLVLRYTDWTLMFYIDGDNNLDIDYVGVFNQLESAADNSNVNILVAWDRSDNGNSAYYEVQHDTNLDETDPAANYTDNVNKWPKGELSMNDPTTLTSFIQWARTIYPAQYYALIISNHGTGLNGTARDDTSGSDWITVRELGEALAAATSNGADKIDLVFADSCLMAMLEDAYQIRNYADMYVASENLLWIPVPGSRNPYVDYVSSIDVSTSPRDLARAIVTHYSAWLDDRYPNRFGYTLSAVDLGQIDGVVTSVDNLALALKSQIGTYSSGLAAARQATQKFDSDNKGLNSNYIINSSDEYIDLYDFAQEVRTQISDITIQNSAQAVINAVNGYVITSTARPGNERYPYPSLNREKVHGVSIFFPKGDFRRSFYTGINLDFAAGSAWGQQSAISVASQDTINWGPMLVEYVGQINPSAPDDPNPPELIGPLSPILRVYLPLVLKKHQSPTLPPEDYRLLQSVVGSCGCSASSANYRSNGTCGQVTVGDVISSTNYRISSGYWTGVNR